MELGAGIKNVEAPVDAGFSFVPLPFQGLDLPAEGFLVGETLSKRVCDNCLNLHWNSLV